MILNTLKHLQANADRKSQTSLNFHQPYANNLGMDSNSDTLRKMFGMGNSFIRNTADMKSKRKWEDVIWRNPSKRALEVVKILLQNPEIRRMYESYIKNGKRSEELMENIPVQRNNENPSLMIDQLDYDSALPVFDKSVVYSTGWLPESSKRGWEAIPIIWKSKKVASKRASIANNDKRGWEELNWKRNARDSILGRLPNQGPDAVNFDSIFLQTKVQGLNYNQSLHPRSDILGKVLSDLMKNEHEQAENMNGYIRDKVTRHLIRENSFPYNYREDNDILQNDKGFESSSAEELCRMLFSDSTDCGIYIKYGKRPDQ